MKNFITFLAAIVFTASTFAQKNELKAAQKAVDSNNFIEAISALKQAEPLMTTAKQKYKTQYYFLLGKANYANGNNPDSFLDAGKALKMVISLEKNTAKKYTAPATEIFNAIIQKISNDAIKDYKSAIELSKQKESLDKSLELFNKAGKGFEQVYVISPKDTAFIQNAGLAYYNGQKHQESMKNYQKLLDLGYTGKSTVYTATSVVNGNPQIFASKKDMDKQVGLKLVKDPQVVVKKSQRSAIIKMIAKNYIALKDNVNALKFIKQAQKDDPNDYGLLVDEANIYYAMGDNLKFKEKLEEAVKINPTDPTLYYNIGVMKMELNDNEGAIESFKKALELKPDYAEAYNNIGAALLEKAEPIIEEMNQNLSNFDKYDALQAKQFDVYREALPYYEKAFKYDKSNISIVRTLLGIYENLEMTDKQKAMQEVYNGMK